MLLPQRSVSTIRKKNHQHPIGKRALRKPQSDQAASSMPLLRAALDRAWQVLATYKEQGDLMGMATSYLEIGDLLLGSGETERAGEMYRLSLSTSRGQGETCQQIQGAGR